MGRWGRRPVRCRRCWKTGHNIRTCPDLPEHLRSLHVTPRKCSWCSKEGHNKQTCQSRKEDKAKYINENAQFRKEWWEQVKQQGIGIGALVTGMARNSENLFMVGGYEWAEVQKRRSTPSAVCLNAVAGDGYPLWGSVMVEEDKKAEYYYRPYNGIDVVSPSTCFPEPPADFFDGSSGVDHFFR